MPGPYPEAARFLQALQIVPENSVVKPNLHRSTGDPSLRSIEDFRADPKYSSDGNRIDLAFAIWALANAGTQEDVSEVLRTRHLSPKGPIIR